MSSERDPSEAVVSTAGVTSHVYDDGGDVLGHALLLDLDGVDAVEAVQVADDLDGISAVLQSSEGSYHVWHLAVDSLREQTLTALSYHAADDAHAGSSWRRGYGVLRVVGKVRESGETYKDRPSLLHVSATSSDLPQSRPHAALLRRYGRDQPGDVSGDPGALDSSDCRWQWTGDESNLRLDSYMSIDDAEKARLRGEQA